ncbi:MAG TPA: alkaline phosphatase family protein [Microlunatus sp.]
MTASVATRSGGTMNTIRVAFVTTMILLVGAACAPAANDTPWPPATSPPSAASAPVQPSASPGSASPGSASQGSAGPPSESISHVVAISIDGLNPRAITELGPSGAPAFHRLMREGAFTLDARTEREQTRTLPNHTGMLTGRRIDASRGGHGVTYNTDIGRRRTVHTSAGEYISSVFDVVHDHGGRTALFATKSKFALYQRTWNTNGGRDRVGVDDGRAKIDRFVVDTDDARLVATTTTYLRNGPGEFVFLHIALPDEIGHADGFMSDKYLAGVRSTDELVGTVLDAIAGQPALQRDTVVLVTADHGGDGASHSDQTKIANYQIPFFAWGPGVPAGRDLYAMNDTRRSPGTARTTYDGPQPIRNGDLGNLATDVLGLPDIPGSQFDADQDLVIFGS